MLSNIIKHMQCTVLLSMKRTKFEKIWQCGKLQQFKQKTNARKWRVSIERCEMDKKVKNVSNPHVSSEDPTKWPSPNPCSLYRML